MLVPGFDQAAAVLAEAVVAFEGRQQLDWVPLIAAFMDDAAKDVADSLYQAAAGITQQPSADLGTVLDLVERGWGEALTRAVAPDADAEQQRQALTHRLTAALEHATVRSGVGRWQGSWSGPAMVVAGDGNPIALDQVAQLATDQRTVAAARDWLVGARIELTGAPQIPGQAGVWQGVTA